ncbi:MAG: glycosyltransferase family 2 protein [Acidimicrobiales bacterium]|nr:glycosyltransferase family 2 protein [Acidimicrobiales bacterium]
MIVRPGSAAVPQSPTSAATVLSDAVLLPVYNEESTVDSVLEAVRRYFDGEIVVVDDGSTDETPRVLAARDDITVVHLDRNCGYGCALKIGYRIAHDIGIKRLITMDCDGQHEPAHIPQFLSAMDAGGDIISGSRYLPGSAKVGVAPESRQAINLRITTEVNAVTGWGLTDAFCGFKAYRLPALDCIRLREPGYAMPLELWAKAWRCGLTVREIPVERIYCDHERTFGVALDDPETRFAYYMDVWTRALKEDS